MAVVAKPVARIFAELATPGRRVFFAVASRLVGGGGSGRSGSFIISRRPRLHRGLRGGALRAHRLRIRHHHRRVRAVGPWTLGSRSLRL